MWWKKVEETVELQVTQGLVGTVRSLALSLSKMESIQVY